MGDRLEKPPVLGTSSKTYAFEVFRQKPRRFEVYRRSHSESSGECLKPDTRLENIHIALLVVLEFQD